MIGLGRHVVAAGQQLDRFARLHGHRGAAVPGPAVAGAVAGGTRAGDLDPRGADIGQRPIGRRRRGGHRGRPAIGGLAGGRGDCGGGARASDRAAAAAAAPPAARAGHSGCCGGVAGGAPPLDRTPADSRAAAAAGWTPAWSAPPSPAPAARMTPPSRWPPRPADRTACTADRTQSDCRHSRRRPRPSSRPRQTPTTWRDRTKSAGVRITTTHSHATITRRVDSIAVNGRLRLMEGERRGPNPTGPRRLTASGRRPAAAARTAPAAARARRGRFRCG